jgi:hypothetical protein
MNKLISYEIISKSQLYLKYKDDNRNETEEILLLSKLNRINKKFHVMAGFGKVNDPDYYVTITLTFVGGVDCSYSCQVSKLRTMDFCKGVGFKSTIKLNNDELVVINHFSPSTNETGIFFYKDKYGNYSEAKLIYSLWDDLIKTF